MKKKFLTGVVLATLLLSQQTSYVWASNQPENAGNGNQEESGNREMPWYDLRERVQDKKEEIVEKREEKKEELTEKRDDLQEKAQEKRGELQEKAQQTRAQILARHTERLRHRFMNVYSERLGNIIEKAQNRFTIMAENGKNMGDAQAKLDEAKTELSSAEQFAQSSIDKFGEIDADKYEVQKAMALEARDLANQAREKFKATLRLTKEAIKLAKEA